MATIAVNVPPNVAQRYEKASPQERERLDAMITAQLQSALNGSTASLRESMDKLSEEAVANGLDDETLEQILREKSA